MGLGTGSDASDGGRGAEPEEGGEEEAASQPTASQRAAREMNARHLRRRWQEQQWATWGDDDRAVQFSYAVELYGSPRFAHLDAAYRHATCMQVLHHYAEALEASVDGDVSAIDAPPFLRRKNHGKHSHRFKLTVRPSAVCAGGEGCEHAPVCRRAQVVPCVHMVPSRGRKVPQRDEAGEEDGDDEDEDEGCRSPAGDLCPARVRRGPRLASTSALPDEVAFYDEVVALLVCVLGQYEAAAEARSRVRREQLLLSLALGRDLDGSATRRSMDGDEGLWWRSLRRVVLSPHLTVGLRALTDEFDALCGRILQVKPGELLDRQVHGLEALDGVRARHQAPLLIAEKLWGLEAEPRYPLGRVPRPPSSARAAAVARRRRRHRRGAGPEAGCRSSDGEVSSASDTEARVARVAPASAPPRRRHSYLPRARHGGGGGADNDATQPTQGLEALLGAAAASDPLSSRCTYCDGAADAAAGGSGALWRCQLCGRSYCHESCCADVAEAAFGADESPEHVCTACASQELRARSFNDRAAQSAVLGALRVVVHPVPLVIRLRDRQLGPAVLLAVQRALSQLADAAHARAVLRDEVRVEANAHRITLGGLRGLAVLERDPVAALDAASALLVRLKGRLAHLPVLGDDDDADSSDSGDNGGGGGAPSRMAQSVVRALSTAVRVVAEGGEEEEGSAEEDEEGEVPAAMRRGHLRQDAREPLRAALAAVDRAAVEQRLLRWVEQRLGPLLPLRHTQVGRVFEARVGHAGGRVQPDGPERDDRVGDEEADPSAAIGAISGPVATRRTQEYRRRVSIFALAELRMNGNAHVRAHGLEQRTYTRHRPAASPPQHTQQTSRLSPPTAVVDELEDATASCGVLRTSAPDVAATGEAPRLEPSGRRRRGLARPAG